MEQWWQTRYISETVVAHQELITELHQCCVPFVFLYFLNVFFQCIALKETLFSLEATTAITCLVLLLFPGEHHLLYKARVVKYKFYGKPNLVVFYEGGFCGSKQSRSPSHIISMAFTYSYQTKWQNLFRRGKIIIHGFWRRFILISRKLRYPR